MFLKLVHFLPMTVPDEFIVNKLKSCINDNHRLFILIQSPEQINQLLNLHTKAIIGAKPTILWLYKTLDSKLKNRFKNEAVFYSYKETEKILGNTFGGLVLQDYESITPNILARSIETISGGGMIILVTDDIQKTEMELLCGQKGKKRFNTRLFKSMIDNDNILVCYENLRCLHKKVNLCKKKENKKNEIAAIKRTRITADDIRQDIYDETINRIYDSAKTDDQHLVITELGKMLNERSCKTVCSVTAARGRGKSAALGMAISLAIFKSLSTIFIAAPNIENVGTIFEFILKGINLLGYKERIHYTVFRKNKNHSRNIYKIVFNKTHHQVIEYINPYEELNTFPDLLVIDEAASIPIPHIKRMLGTNLIFMASTVSGYEGTGRSLSLKLFNELRTKSKNENLFLFKELQLCDPIRYASDDPIENWLNETLHLNSVPLSIGCCPAPDDCDLFYINKDALFQHHRMSEIFLKNLVSLFVASHYKNSPDDILLMADVDSHHIFTLLTPFDENSGELPKIICAIQVAYENIENRTKREGNLIPWTLYDNYLRDEFLEMRGIRIVRIAVHPDYTRMGYGTRAIKQLCDFYTDTTTRITKEDNSLILPLSNTKRESIDYIGSSFGATNDLLNFWKKVGFVPVYLRQSKSLITGEHSVIVMRSKNSNILEIHSEHQIRFLRLLSSSYKQLKPTLCLSLFYNIGMKPGITEFRTTFSNNDMKRMKFFYRGLSEIGLIHDLIYSFAFIFFTGQLQLELNVLEQCVLMSIGLQHMTFFDVADILNIEKQRVKSVLSKIIMKLYEKIK